MSLSIYARVWTLRIDIILCWLRSKNVLFINNLVDTIVDKLAVIYLLSTRVIWYSYILLLWREHGDPNSRNLIEPLFSRFWSTSHWMCVSVNVTKLHGTNAVIEAQEPTEKSCENFITLLWFHDIRLSLYLGIHVTSSGCDIKEESKPDKEGRRATIINLFS